MGYEFSVLIPTYCKEKADNLNLAIKSVIEQTLKPNEILIIQDGELGEDLKSIIIKYKELYPELINIIKFEQNQGIGKVRTIGIKKAKYELIAFMDSDDISRNDRFEKQIQFLKDNPDIDMVGAWVTEFDGNPENIYSKRTLPTEYTKIYQFANLFFQKALKVLNVGGCVPFVYFCTLFVFVESVFILGEPLYFTDILGSLIIVSFHCYNAWYPIKNQQ